MERGPEFGFFIAAAACLLTAGAGWGTLLLWRIAFSGSFTGISIHDVNAHGLAQIFGWVLLSVMGAGYRMFPRFWNAELAAPTLVRPVFWTMITGLLLSVLGMQLHSSGTWAVATATLGGSAILLGTMIFVAQMVGTFARGSSRFDPATAFIFGALAWAVVMALVSLWYTTITLSATDRGEVILLVSTWQPSLRSIQLRGFALFVIIGVALRVFRGLFQLPGVGERRAWTAFVVLTLAVVCESIAFVLMRTTGHFAWGGVMVLGWMMLASGVLLVALPWRPWRDFPVPHRANKFIRAALAWLAVGISMLLLTPAYQAMQGSFFSHAYYGATRHAFTVGFISMMVVGVASRFVPRLRGIDGPQLPPLILSFVLLNAGCMLRVVGQPITDWVPGLMPVIAVSGVLEFAGFLIWAIDLLRVLRRPELGMRSELAQGRLMTLPVITSPTMGGAHR